MAERRMFAKTIIDSDAFLDMPMSAQLLYFHLSMRADDDGFLNNPKKIQRMIGASNDDLKLLIAKSFIIKFESGVVVIKHWRIHNYIQKDRYKPTVYAEEMAKLSIKDNKAYTLGLNPEIEQMDTECIQDGYGLETQVRLGKDSIGKDRLGKEILCPEPKKIDSEQEDKTIYADVSAIPLNDGTEWRMPLELYEEYVKAYPALDIKQEVSQMRIWALSNPTRRKTKRGMTKFVNGWLERSQNNPRKNNNNSNTTDWSNIH